MTDISVAEHRAQVPPLAYAAVSEADVGDYVALLKPRVMSLVVFTALVGLMVAPGHVHPVIGFTALLCIAIGAGASGALNMWYDADIDALMTRTANRPIPRRRIAPGEALAFGLVLAGRRRDGDGAAGELARRRRCWPSPSSSTSSIYTMWLKRSTPQNIVIGGAAGAFPPMIGWAAVTGSVSLEPVLLFLIIFFWTPPHFWALALLRVDDYARAGVPMLPVVAGAGETRRQIVIYSAVLLVDRRGALVHGLCRRGLRRHRAGRRHRHARARAAGLARGRRRAGPAGGAAAVRLLDPLSLRPLRRAADRSRFPDGGVKCGHGREQARSAGIVLTEAQKRSRRARSIAIAVVLGVLVVLFYIVTLVKGPAVLNRPL